VLARGGEEARILGDRGNVVVLEDRPKPAAVGFGIPVDRVFAAKSCEDLVRRAVHVEVRVLEIDVIELHLDGLPGLVQRRSRPSCCRVRSSSAAWILGSETPR